MTVVDSRRNGRAADVVERAAAFRWRLKRVDDNHRDAVATEDSPRSILTPGQSVEVKACLRWISNGDTYGTRGRWHVHRPTHQQLLADSGEYALSVYQRVADGEHIVVCRLALLPAAIVDGWLSDDGGTAVKLPWDRVFVDVPIAGGSA